MIFICTITVLALSESQHLAVVTKPIATSKKIFSLGKYLEFSYSLQVPGRGYAFKKIIILEAFILILHQ